MSFKTVAYCIGFLGLLIASDNAYSIATGDNKWLLNKIQTNQEERYADKIAEAATTNKGMIQKAQGLVAEVNKNQKNLSLDNSGLKPSNNGILANGQGVNISELLSRYSNKNFLEKEIDNLPSLLVFISLGIPENSLKQLATQVRKANGVLVLRGIYQGSLQKTIRAIYELNKHGVKAIIHPELFKKYNVSMVPVFVLENKQNNTCLNDRCTYDKLAGNVSLKYVLEQFYEDGHDKDLAKKYLERIKGREL